MTTDDDEAEHVRRAMVGDEAAFEELVGGHRVRLWSICLRITGNQQDAEDALQDALMAAWLHLGSFRLESRFGTWIYRIAANAAIGVLRRRRDVPTEPAEMPERDAHGDHAQTVVDRVEVRARIARLPEPFREALVLREIGDLTYEEIAAHQDVGIQTVKSRLHRARAALNAGFEQ